MKKLLIFVSAIITISLMMSDAGMAEPTHPNEVGLYLTEDGTGPTGTYVLGSPVVVYLVLTKPADVENGDVPYPSINGFECRLDFHPVPDNDLLLLDHVIPPQCIDFGPDKDMNMGFLEFLVGAISPSTIPVVNEAVVLVTMTFMNLNPATTVVTVGPPSWNPQMVFAVAGGGHEMYSIGGSVDAGVFEFNGEAVAVENESFGSVKALFR
jgi:hypothetical protein